MKPINLPMSQEYDAIVERLRGKMAKFNPEGRVISKTHSLRYAMRIADGATPGHALVQKILAGEERRGKKRVHRKSPTKPKRA